MKGISKRMLPNIARAAALLSLTVSNSAAFSTPSLPQGQGRANKINVRCGQQCDSTPNFGPYPARTYQARFMSSDPDASSTAATEKPINGNGISNEPSKPAKISRSFVPKARRPTTDVGMRYRSDDWIMNLLSIPRSYLLRRIKSHLIFDQMVCILILLARNKLGWKRLSIPLLGHNLVGGFLGLLLAYRTNSAYARFADARGYWAKAASTCRCLAFETVSHVRPYAPKSAKKLERLIVAFPDVLAYTCLAGNQKARLPEFEWQLLYGDMDGTTEDVDDESIISPATVILQKMHHCLHEAAYEIKEEKFLFDLHLTAIGAEVNHLSDALSGCEKIVDTPVPLSYSRHTSRFLTLWCGFLPLAITPQIGWLSVPLMGIVSWLLYGLEEIGHLIEQPFVPVTDKPSYLISDDVIDDDRASKTQPYDIGLPICSLAEKIRIEVEKIVSMRGITA